MPLSPERSRSCFCGLLSYCYGRCAGTTTNDDPWQHARKRCAVAGDHLRRGAVQSPSGVGRGCLCRWYNGAAFRAAWSARCAALSVRRRSLTGTNVRPPACLAYTPNFGFFPRGDACFKPKPQTIGDECLCDEAGKGYPPARLAPGIARSGSMN